MATLDYGAIGFDYCSSHCSIVFSNGDSPDETPTGFTCSSGRNGSGSGPIFQSNQVVCKGSMNKHLNVIIFLSRSKEALR